MKYSYLFLLVFLLNTKAYSQQQGKPKIVPGSSRIQEYLPQIKGKNLGIFANQTSMINDVHLADSLVSLGMKVTRIFGPEHGFRGDADAGEKVTSTIDKKTGIEIISLYGDHKKPTAKELADIDIMIFDIQDVGTRFYTYISSLQYFLEAAIENNKPLIILDRPNPNGFYVDGPVLDMKYKSFVGMQPIPIVYGLTIGEYATMLLGEKWVKTPMNFDLVIKGRKKGHGAEKNITPGKFSLTIIANDHYDHRSHYELPVKPSPNLPSIESIYWYPSTCFFEATNLSEGRGTEKPFQVFGHPDYPASMAAFTPVSMPGAKSPKLLNQKCYGWDLSGSKEHILKKIDGKIRIDLLLEAYRLFPDKEKFFLNATSLNRLAGNDELMKQVKAGMDENSIRKSWEPKLGNYKKMRKKYLLYDDF